MAVTVGSLKPGDKFVFLDGGKKPGVRGERGEDAMEGVTVWLDQGTRRRKLETWHPLIRVVPLK